jgi:N-acetylmuramoyl-L-alanine amidase
MKVTNHRLVNDNGAPVPYVASPNFYSSVKPTYLIIHYTAGPNASGAINHFKAEGTASAHLVIDRDGSITQMVPFDKGAWHAGKSKFGSTSGLNRHSIGIELVNIGRLTKREDGTWANWNNSISVPNSEVTVLTHKLESHPAGWHLYTQAQLSAAVAAAQAMHAAYGFTDILGHDDIAVPKGRKVDPGPAFNMISFRSSVIR